MAQVTLGNKKKVVLQVNYGDKTISIPVRKCLTLAEVTAIKNAEDGLWLFRKYIPEEIFNELTGEDIQRLTKAWQDASTEAEDSPVSVGE
jgi:hypothetical protein